MSLNLRVKSRAGLRVALVVIALSPRLAIANDSQAATNLFVARGGIVCDDEADIVKVRRVINSLRYFGQIRALKNEKRCQIYAKREKIIDVLHSSRSDRLTSIQVRTGDKPDQMRWMLRKDMREIAR